MADFGSLARPHIEKLLEPGESLLGIGAANHPKDWRLDDPAGARDAYREIVARPELRGRIKPT